MRRSDHCGPVNTSKKVFYGSVGKLLKYWPGGSYLLMNSIPSVPVDKNIMVIGFKYNFIGGS